MRMSKMMVKTLREAPAEAELPSHQLLLRAGLIVPLAAGLYCFTPLGWRVHRRIEAIIREEMDRYGAQEVHLPALHPLETWEQSGRAKTMGQVLFHLQDRRERDFVLGPTHEEVMSYLASRNIQSYRDLPFTLYQIQTKFRDEQRPRGGLIRLREFFMKDAYSFDADWESLDQSYQDAFDAYLRIFSRAGVPVIPVDADSGAIGGKDSQEFVFLTASGEDEVLLCDTCGYAANAEKAEFLPSEPVEAADAEQRAVEDVATPGVSTIVDLAKVLGVEERQTAKAVFYVADGEPVFVCIRGDLEVNETKLQNALKATELTPMNEATVRQHGLIAGSASAVGLEGMRVVADASATKAANLVAGANRPDVHLKNVNYGRDWKADIVTDIALARMGDACLRCEGRLTVRRGIEMAHVFKLGTMYSEAIGVHFLDEAGARQPAVMGCYGLGLERLLAAIIEANHDADGIAWPVSVTPYDVHIVVIGGDNDEVSAALSELESRIEGAGLAALVDDRDDSPGAKFKDADLLGMPIRLTISPRALKSGGVEFKLRRGGEPRVVPLVDVVRGVREALEALEAGGIGTA